MGGGEFPFLCRSPESLTRDEKFRAVFSKELHVYQKNTFAVVCDELQSTLICLTGKRIHFYSTIKYEDV